MGSTRKLVSENENSKKTFAMISSFLKDMGLWNLWKLYTKSNEFGNFMGFYPERKHWLNVDNPFDVFGNVDFATYLIKVHGMRLFPEFMNPLFNVYCSILWPVTFKRYGREINPSYVAFLKKHGCYYKWMEDLEIKGQREKENHHEY